MQLTAGGRTDSGPRPLNQDWLHWDLELGLFVVADGMGGHAAGEIASQEAVETVYGMVKRGIGNLHELADPLVEEDVRAAMAI